MENWYVVTLSYAHFGIDTVDDIVTDTPKVAKWMLGLHISKVEEYVKRKGGRIKLYTEYAKGGVVAGSTEVVLKSGEQVVENTEILKTIKKLKENE